MSRLIVVQKVLSAILRNKLRLWCLTLASRLALVRLLDEWESRRRMHGLHQGLRRGLSRSGGGAGWGRSMRLWHAHRIGQQRHSWCREKRLVSARSARL